jgi:hypothetical protein
MAAGFQVSISQENQPSGSYILVSEIDFIAIPRSPRFKGRENGWSIKVSLQKKKKRKKERKKAFGMGESFWQSCFWKMQSITYRL